MLIDSVVIVLREVLEAALLVSVLLAATRRLATPGPGLGLAAALGVCGAWLFGAAMRPISSWFDGVGFEVVNSLLQLAIYIAILAVIGLLGAGGRRARATLPWAMVAAVSLAIVREGAEILLYFSGFLHQIGATADVLAGAVLGLGVGFSTGALFYYLLIALPPARALRVAVGLLVLVGAGMCAQATALLIQADWLSVAGPVWDTSAWLPESSAIGQLLYALIGYEASPSAPEVGVYLGSMLAMLAAFLLARFVRPESGDSAA